MYWVDLYYLLYQLTAVLVLFFEVTN